MRQIWQEPLQIWVYSGWNIVGTVPNTDYIMSTILSNIHLTRTTTDLSLLWMKHCRNSSKYWLYNVDNLEQYQFDNNHYRTDYIVDETLSEQFKNIIEIQSIILCCWLFSSSCVPYVASFSGLSVCDCLFGIL